MKYVPSLHTRIVACLLLVCLLLSLCACDEQVATSPVVGDVPPPPSSSSSSSSSVEQVPQQPDPNLFVPTEAYVIVYPSELAEDPVMQEAIAYLNVVMQSAYGFTLSVKDDDQTPHSHEILLGLTSREQSSKLLKDFAVEDFAYSIQAKNVIVMGGKSSSATLQAVKQFCLDVIGYTGNGDIFSKPPAMKLGTVYTNRKYESISINGAPLSEWTIGMDPTLPEAESLATQLVDYFFYYTNEQIAVVKADELTGEETNLIALGGIGREMKTPYFRGSYYVSETDEKGSVISMLPTENDGLQPMLDIFWSELESRTEGKHIAFTVPVADKVRFATEDYPNVPTWYLDSETQTEFYEGVTYIEQCFYDDEGLPYRTFALRIDPDKVNFHMGSSKDGYALAPTAANRQNTKQHMQAAVANGKNIIAGINANFFNMNGDYSPKGLAIKDGTVIHGSTPGRAFFGTTESGKVIVDYEDNYQAYVAEGETFLQAVGGSSFWLKDGVLPQGLYGTDQTVNPRTLLGQCADGTIVFGVIDGRRASYSNGAGGARAATWMRSLGAVDVINLDGGGSSTFILRDPTTDTYDVCNSPSDSGGLRKIYNSLLVEIKD